MISGALKGAGPHFFSKVYGQIVKLSTLQLQKRRPRYSAFKVKIELVLVAMGY